MCLLLGFSPLAVTPQGGWGLLLTRRDSTCSSPLAAAHPGLTSKSDLPLWVTPCPWLGQDTAVVSLKSTLQGGRAGWEHSPGNAGKSQQGCCSLTPLMAPKDGRAHTRYLQCSICLSDNLVSLSLYPALSHLCSAAPDLPFPAGRNEDMAWSSPLKVSQGKHWSDGSVSVG